MMVWEEDGPSPFFTAEGRGLLIPADDGVVTSLGGSCGQGGRAEASCSITGNQRFALRLSNAAPSSMVFAVLAARQLGFGAQCGPCTLIPDASTGFVVNSLSSASGSASLSFAIPATPSLVGQAFYQQWLVAPPAGLCFGVDMSDALRVEIQ